ncbi:MAG: FAD-linked oxidase C-terminal domain-containing protein, partial [Oscillospiraceae bacterium]
LFIGSDGTLGVLSSIELSLIEQPPVIWSADCFFSEEEQALRFVELARETLEDLAALEYFDCFALDILREQKRSNTAFSQLPELLERHRYAIYIELHCDDEQRATQQLFLAGEQMRQAGGDEQDTWVARTAFDKDTLLFFRHAVPESVNMLIDQRKKTNPIITKLGTDMAVPDGCLREVMAMYRRDLAAQGLEYAIWGHIGNNHLHVNILPRDAADYQKGKALYGEWAAAVTQLGGAVSAEHGVGKSKVAYLEIMYGLSHIREMAALKRAFDPQGLLGTGNMFTLEKEAAHL